jgi:hypothetical protein
MLAYLFVFAGEEGPKTYSATYEEFLNDLEVDASSSSVTFKTYDDGDIVDITGTVDKVKLADVPAGTVGADSGTWTLVYFEPPSASTVDMYDCFAYKGDKSDEYTVGEEGTVRVHIKKMSVMGMTTEYPEECMKADAVEDYIPVPTVMYEDFLDDINIDISSMVVTFDSYDDGDIVDVVGTVENIRFADVPSGVVGLDSGTWTIVYFEPPSSSTMIIFDSFAYKGDISDEYTVGEEGTVTVHIVEMSAMGITMEYPEESMTADMLEDYILVPTASMDFTETSPGNYTGGIVSASAEIYLNEIEIEIYDSSSGSYGTDDGDLTDDSPEEVDVWYGNLTLEFTDVNDNSKLDAADVFTLTNADSGDEITIYDTYSYDEIASYTII